LVAHDVLSLLFEDDGGDFDFRQARSSISATTYTAVMAMPKSPMYEFMSGTYRGVRRACR
jgi:hypothetical protein